MKKDIPKKPIKKTQMGLSWLDNMKK